MRKFTETDVRTLWLIEVLYSYLWLQYDDNDGSKGTLHLVHLRVGSGSYSHFLRYRPHFFANNQHFSGTYRLRIKGDIFQIGDQMRPQEDFWT